MLLVIDVGSRSMGEVVVPGPRLVTAAKCTVLRMLDVVAEFSLKGEWNEVLIAKWQAAFTTLTALDKGQLCQLPLEHPGIKLLMGACCTLDTVFLCLLCVPSFQVTLRQLMSQA